ncbi:zinc finger protein 62-like isoform X2 [Nymphalis io]|nr:zinc finger protein 62-like isoform X2 [Nymphalis io]
MKLSDDINSYKALKTPSIVTCDFCDKKFNNRYDSIVHNASHIIIPLWSQTLYRCNLCNTYTTVDDIETHNARKHTITVNNKPKYDINGLKTQTVLTEYNNTDVKCEMIYEINAEEDDKKTLETVEPIRNRLKFEEDITANGLIRDLVTQCNVNIQLMDPPWVYPPSKYSNCDMFNGDLIKCNVNDVSKNVQAHEEPEYISIDYSSLMKPGIFSCKYCSNSYPNRFSLIKHEMDHIRILQGKPLLCLYCDKFIAGNYKTLNSHIAKYHPNVKAKKFKTFNCKRCGLRFRKYKRHVRNYHIYDCLECGLEFNSNEQLANHKDISNCPKYKSKMLKVCDLCFSFMKRRINLIYSLMGDTADEVGVRYPCDNCGKKYFVLKLVKRIQKERRCCYRDQRNVTNEDRLKNIQHRLKRLNLLHKF